MVTVQCRHQTPLAVVGHDNEVVGVNAVRFENPQRVRPFLVDDSREVSSGNAVAIRIVHTGFVPLVLSNQTKSRH